MHDTLPSEHRQRVLRAQALLSAMEREMKRSLEGLRVPGSPRPYHLMYSLRRTEAVDLKAAYGSMVRNRSYDRSALYVDVRVGNHRFDNVVDGGLHDEATERESADWLDAPDDLDPEALQVALWKLTQLRFDEALEDYLDHRKAMVSEFLRDEVEAFSRERPIHHIEDLTEVPFPVQAWAATLRELSRGFTQHPWIFDPALNLRAERIQRWLVNSEGTRVLTEDLFVEVYVGGWVLTEDGAYVEASRTLYARSVDRVPTADALRAAADEIVAELRELENAESPASFIGPALLAGQAAATMFHEALGHRLEGERLVARGETRTFAERLGERILPTGLSVVDDPTITEACGQELYGSYRVDDQGVKAQRAELVKDGVLTGFLQSRHPSRHGQHSNGHGRHDGVEGVMARMGNLIIEGDPAHAKSWDALLEQLGELARSRGSRYAAIIRRVDAGETSTSSYDFQVFKGELAEVALLDVETGAVRRVRDVEFIGTPLSALQRIVAYGAEPEVDQGFCYAESGAVPVSGVSPAVLLSEVELQQRSTAGFHEPLLPPPFADDGSRGRSAKLRGRGQRRRNRRS